VGLCVTREREKLVLCIYSAENEYWKPFRYFSIDTYGYFWQHYIALGLLFQMLF